MTASASWTTGSLLAACAMCAACNSHPGFPSAPLDAAPADALPTSGDAGSDAVTVTVTLHGAPASGVAVYFQSADSSLVLAVATDPRGIAAASLAAGGYVTVIEPDDGSGTGTQLATFAAVQPRDALHLDVVPAGAIDATVVTVTLPTVPDATGYRLLTSCGEVVLDTSGTGSGQLTGCGGAADMVAMALDATTTAPFLGSLYATGVPVDRPVVLDGHYDPPATTQFAYTGVPASSIGVSIHQVIQTARGGLYDVTTSAPVSAGQATTGLGLPAASGALGLTVSEPLPADSDVGEHRVFEWGALGPSYLLDFASALLPAYASAPTYDPASRSVSWTEAAGGVPPGLVRAQIHAFRDGAPDGRRWSWTIVAPRGAAPSVMFPQFPPDGFDFTPHAGDAIGVDDVTTVSAALGYDAVRAHGFDHLETYAAGASGRFAVQSVHAPQL